MITSVLYPPKNVGENFEKHVSTMDNFLIFQVLIMKVIVICSAIFLPLILKQDTASFVITIIIALEFWSCKNLARSYLKAHWFVDTTTEKDRWVYEAEIQSPGTFEGLFWYSSLLYIILIFVCMVYYISRNSLSISVSTFIGLICAYLNFFAYGKIIKARNEGLLSKIKSDVDKNGQIQNSKAAVQMQLITVRSELKQISESNEYQIERYE